MKTCLAIAALIAVAGLAPLTMRAQDIDSMPPVVVKTVPESGAKDVISGEMEIKVTFSKEMRDGSWSWSTAWKDSSPEVIGKPHYAADGKTCVIKVKLEAGKTYGYWLNSQKFTISKTSRDTRPCLTCWYFKPSHNNCPESGKNLTQRSPSIKGT